MVQKIMRKAKVDRAASIVEGLVSLNPRTQTLPNGGIDSTKNGIGGVQQTTLPNGGSKSTKSK